jgi:hypothetical protein
MESRDNPSLCKAGGASGIFFRITITKEYNQQIKNQLMKINISVGYQNH